MVYKEIADVFDSAGYDISDMDVDYLIILGSDKVLLNTLLSLKNRSPPIVALYAHGTRSYLSIGGIEEFPIIIKRLIKREYVIEKRLRLKAKIKSIDLPPALNDIVILPKTSGRVMRYTLEINNESIWRDEGDGVIISTPTGSTAYSLSAGGPIITLDSPVLSIVPINSMVLIHKPIITSSKNTIKIRDISPNNVEILIDGQIRKTISDEEVEITRSPYDAHFIRTLDIRYGLLDRKLRDKAVKKTRIFSVKDLPPSARLIFKILEYEGPLSRQELLVKSGLPNRTLSYALKTLLKRDLIIKVPSDESLRDITYMIRE